MNPVLMQWLPLTLDEANRLASACETHQERLIVWTAIPAAGPIASDVRFKKRVLGSLAIHFALIPVFPQSEKARCLLEKDTKS